MDQVGQAASLPPPGSEYIVQDTDRAYNEARTQQNFSSPIDNHHFVSGSAVEPPSLLHLPEAFVRSTLTMDASDSAHPRAARSGHATPASHFNRRTPSQVVANPCDDAVIAA